MEQITEQIYTLYFYSLNCHRDYFQLIVLDNFVDGFETVLFGPLSINTCIN